MLSQQKNAEQKIVKQPEQLGKSNFHAERRSFPEAADVDHSKTEAAVKAFSQLSNGIDQKADLGALQHSVFKDRGLVCNNRLNDARLAEEGQIHNFRIKWGNNGFALDQLQIALQRFENKVTANGTNLKAKILTYIQGLIDTLYSRGGVQPPGLAGINSTTQSKRNDPKILQRSLNRKADIVFRAFVSGSGGAADQQVMRVLLSMQHDQLEQLRQAYKLRFDRDLDEDLRSHLSLKAFRKIDRILKSSRYLNRMRRSVERAAEKRACKVEKQLAQSSLMKREAINQILQDQDLIVAFRKLFGRTLVGELRKKLALLEAGSEETW